MTNTYFIDIDGVLLRHNGSLDAQMTVKEILPHTLSFLNQIEYNGGKIILTTGRKESMRKLTEKQLTNMGIFYDQLVMGLNRGPRILINDLKPKFKPKTAFAFTPERNNLDEDLIEKIVKPCEERPWGSFSTLAYDKKYHVKEIRVSPGNKSSLQSHKNRDELWVVVSGIGYGVVEKDNLKMKNRLIPGECFRVLRGEKHRVINEGDEDFVFIEVQTGDSFSEGDIERFEDEYGRA